MMMENDYTDRDDPELQVWSREVKIRDEFTCQICGVRGVQLESHHKNGFNAFPNERLDISNGVTLCKRCHIRFHSIFGKGGNTKFQYNQYEKTAKIFRQLLSSENPPGLLSYSESVKASDKVNNDK